MKVRGSFLHWLRELARNVFNSSARDADLTAHVTSYIDMLTEEKIAAGMTPEVARRAALVEFGSIEAVKDDTREARAGALLAQLAQDVRYALRMIRRDRSFSMIAILTLALGIGANTAIFSVVKAVLLEPLPYADPDRLVLVWERNMLIGKERDPVAAPNFLDWRQQSKAFHDLGAYRFRSFALSQIDRAEQLQALSMTSNVFRVLRVDAMVGRVFSEDEERRQEPVVVLTHELWQRRFGGNPAIAGQAITLNGATHTVVGVMGPGFNFPDGNPVDLYTPMLFNQADLTGRRTHTLTVIGRLKEGVSIETAKTDLGLIAQRIAEANTGSNPDVTIVGALDVLVEDVRLGLVVLLGTVGFVLLIACANVASLLLVRATSRRREIAVRAALGAGTRRLVRQLLTESVVLAMLGAVAGTLMAWWLLRVFVRFRPLDLPRVDQVTIDAPVLIFVAITAILTGITFGLVPAWQASAPRLSDATKDNSPQTTAALTGIRARSLLVVAEIALSLMLLASAGLMIRSLFKLQNVDLGFEAKNLVTAQLLLAYSRYPIDASQYRPVKPDAPPVATSKASLFFAQLEETLGTMQGVESVGAVSALPLNPVGSDYDLPVIIEGRPRPRTGEEPQADFRVATPGYFRTMGISLLYGREFNQFDGPNSTPVAIINDTTAQQLFGGEDPIGSRILLYGRPREIVGVVGSVRHHGFSRDARPEMILPYHQFQANAMTLVVRSTIEPSALATVMAEAVHGLDADQPVYRVRPMHDFIADSVAQPQFTTLLLASFATLALVLAVIGVYGVMSYSVSQRSREIGVRLALGAQRRQVMRMVVRQGMIYAVAGVISGLILAATTTRLINGLLFGVTAMDPLTFVAAAVALMVASLAAMCLPAFRAARVSPVTVLRSE